MTLTTEPLSLTGPHWYWGRPVRPPIVALAMSLSVALLLESLHSPHRPACILAVLLVESKTNWNWAVGCWQTYTLDAITRPECIEHA